MKKALVTGGCGFVGRHFTRHLLDTGWHVTGIDNMVAGVHPKEWAFKPKQTDNFEAGYWDIRDYMRKGSSDPFDLIVHCAAIVGGRLTIDNDPLHVATDLSIDAEFFSWLARHKRRDQKIVYFSSSAVYPAYLQGKARMALSEHMVGFGRDVGMPDASYGWSKLTGEYLAKLAVEKYGLDVSIYRPFSGYGEDQDFAYPFPSIIRRVVNREDPIVIWGSGAQTRDFIHIDDVVAAVMETMYELTRGEALNLGTGKGTSFFELVTSARNLLGQPATVKTDPSKPEGVFYRVANVDKLHLMYTPKVSLEEGIRRVAEHLTRQQAGLTKQKA